MLPHRLKGRYLHTTCVSHYDGTHKKIIHFGGFDEVPEEDDPDTWHLMGETTIVELGEWSAPHSHCCYGVHLIHSGHLTVVRWVKAGFIVNKTTGHRKFMVYFVDKKSTIGFCFVSCYCIGLIMLTSKLVSMEMSHLLVNSVH